MSQGFITWNRTPNAEVYLYFNHRYNAWAGIFYLTLKSSSIEFGLVVHLHCMSNHAVKSTRLTGPDKVQCRSLVVRASSGIKGLCIHRVTYLTEKINSSFLKSHTTQESSVAIHKWPEVKAATQKENMYTVTISLRAIQLSVCPHCYFWLISKQNIWNSLLQEAVLPISAPTIILTSSFDQCKQNPSLGS